MSAQTASCTASPTTVTVGETVTFDASGSDAAYVEFDIDGDGSYERTDETDFTITTNYSQPGTYETSARAHGNSTDTAYCGTITVQAANQPPNAALSVSPNPTTPGQQTTLDASNSSDPDGSIVEYQWDVDGDGAVENRTDGPRLQHSYATTGNYAVNVTVVDDDGATDSASADLTVRAENRPPSAAFTVSPRPGQAGSRSMFDASDSSDPDGTIAVYGWDFDGDGSVERTTETPRTNYTYQTAGSYGPQLVVADNDGATDTASRDYRVESATTLQPACTIESTSVAPGDPVVIDARGSEGGQYLDYDPNGDGQYEVLERVNFTYTTHYNESGTYTPLVRVHGGGETAIAECPTVTVRAENQPPSAAFTVSPRPGQAGSRSMFDASNSSDPDGSIVAYRWDFDGDGSVERTTETPRTNYTYQTAGSYGPRLVVADDDGTTDTAGRDYRVEDVTTLQPACTIESTSVAPGDPVVIDARGSEGGRYLDYDPNGDGQYEVLERVNFTYRAHYNESGTYTPLVRVHGGGETAIAECPTVTVESENRPPHAAFTVTPSGPATNQTVTFDASNSSDPDGTVVTYRWDFQGDGRVDAVTNASTVTFTYTTKGPRGPTLEVVDDDGATDRTGRDLYVERGAAGPESPPGEHGAAGSESGTGGGGDIPVVPIGVGGAGALALGLGGYYFFGTGGGAGGGAGGGGGGDSHAPHPKPTPGEDPTLRYETGVFALPSTSGTVSVPVDFAPDLLLFSATNAARTDAATDRTAGWSRGVAHVTDDGVDCRSVTVADDAHATDQATCATDDGHVLQLVRHQPEAAPGRVQVAVADTGSEGVTVDVTVPGDDPLAGGIRVNYQAIRFPSGVEAAVGDFLTPTEPGTETVDLGVDADHVSLLGSSAVDGTGRLWTTDRAVALGLGQAVDAGGDGSEGGLAQTAVGAGTWPRAGHVGSGVARTDRGLHLLYQDADRLAGRTTATVAALGETLRLDYDRVYNGPHKLGSTERHVVPYLALAGGEAVRPAVGAVSLPAAGESITVDCGFEPAMIEVTVTGGPLGEEVERGATAHPFGWSFGTAIADEDRIRQYVLHHAHVPAPAGGAGTADARTGTADPTAVGDVATGTTTTGDAATDGGLPSLSAARDPIAVPTDDDGATDPTTAPNPPESPDDERVGIHLRRDESGAIVRREALSVAATTDTGFELSVRGMAIGADEGAAAAGARPAISYRAWPAADAERADTDTTDPDGNSDGRP